MRRRQFLMRSSLLGAPMLAPQLVLANNNPIRLDTPVLICLFQRGGADGLNMVVPHGEGRYYDLRPTLALPEDQLIDLDGFFGLHPSLLPLTDFWNANELAIIHAVGSPSDSRSHFDSQDFMERGNPDNQANVFDGWLNRYLQGVQNDSGNQMAEVDDIASPFRAISLGQTLPLSLRGAANALSIGDLDSFRLVTPASETRVMREMLTEFYDMPSGLNGGLDQQASQVFAAIDQLNNSDPSAIPAANGAVYPANGFGRQMAELAQLIKVGIGVQVACVEIAGWDHHDQQSEQLPGLLAGLAGGLSAFRQDMGGAMDNITIVTMTEFGRRAAENGSSGTDHGHGSVMMALGGGVNGGIYGDWPGLAQSQLNRGDLEVTTDFRSVLTELLQRRMPAADLAHVFPGFSGPSSLGVFA